MKRFFYIMLTIVGLLLFFTGSFLYVKAAPDDDVSTTQQQQTTKVWMSFLLDPTEINAIDRFFPFNEEQFCKKPSEINLNTQALKNYRFERFITDKETPIGRQWTGVEGNDVYKSGNSTLLIPQSYIRPNHAIFYQERPRIIFPRAVD